MNPIGWIEIPVADMDRAIRCYNTLFGWDLKAVDIGPLVMAWFPAAPGAGGAGGSLVKQDSYIPSQEGPLVYFSCTDVQEQVDRFAAAGCRVIKPKSMISEEHGYMAAAVDSEGNRIGFHSPV
jgi:predicted enzyme related to lactoylglutathione lyase